MSHSAHRISTLLAIFLLTMFSAQTAFGLESDLAEQRLEHLFDWLDAHQLFQGAVLVADAGEVVFCDAYGLANREWKIPNTPDTRHRIASLSKQFTAIVVLQLADEGRLSLDDTLAVHLDGLPDRWARRVTVHQLLDQTSGIPNYTLLPDYTDSIGSKRFTRDAFFALVCRDTLFQDLRFEPGSDWEYSNTNYFLLGLLAERIAGKPYEELVQDRIFDPLGMRDSGVFDSSKPVAQMATGYETTPEGRFERTTPDVVSPKSAPSGGLYSTVYDLLKWSRALRNGSLLSPAMTKTMTTPTLNPGDDLGYACGNWREFREIPGGDRVEIFSHGGSSSGISTWLLRVPAQERSVILLHNGGMGRELTFDKISLAVLDILDGVEDALPRFDLVGPLAGTYFNHRDLLVAHYRRLKEHHADVYDFRPESLSQIGQLLVTVVDDKDAALLLFRLNVAEYPGSALARTDLGGLLLDLEQHEEALEHLLKARELDATPDEELDALIERIERLLRE